MRYTERYGNQIKFAHITKRRRLHGISLPETKQVKNLGRSAGAKKENAPKPCEKDKGTEKGFNESDYISLGEPMLSIVRAIAAKPTEAENISASLNIPFGQLLTALSMLELQGIIKRNSDGKYTLK